MDAISHPRLKGSCKETERLFQNNFGQIMKTKPGWLVVILISSVQLVILLLAVLLLFSWFAGETEETVQNQVCEDNRVIAQHILKDVKTENVMAIGLDSEDFGRLSEIVRKVQMPNHGFVCVVNGRDGSTICPRRGETNFTNVDMSEVVFHDLRHGASQDVALETLVKNISNKVDRRSAIGYIRYAGKKYFVSADYIPQLNSILVVGQERNRLIASAANALAYTQRIVFAATLLIGLACLGMFISILNRQQAESLTVEQGLKKEVSRRERELIQTQNAVIFGLAKLAESRDNDTGEHLERIRSYVTILAEDLATRLEEIDESFIHMLALASSLHDIGKVGIPDSILLKPGRLTPEEREVMELHALIGGECLEAIQARLGNNSVFMHIAKQIAYYHHERWDGGGYPHGLTEDEIPLVARIVAVADVYDALTSKRPYKKPMSHLESKAIILAGSGSHFDPEIVGAFLRHEDRFEAVSRSQLEISDSDAKSEFRELCERVKPHGASTPG